MKRFQPVMMVTIISLMALVGCNKVEQPNTQASPSENTTKTVANSTEATDFKGLEGVITNTKTAVEAGNFTKAKGEFEKFEDFWSKVEDGIKAKSPNTYKDIEDQADEIKAGLKSSKPNKQKVLTALASLSKNVTSVAKP
ncbi:DUF4363 domain-containing protein [Nostoc sp. CMAA1605]|uniref:DUF4363 domain-containing protein n=1 Tax=Nostoc sp. CMAA1605 TaxID=2055159 RepID=UPI001F296F41|nr:DUF4363 domain-containing protein [Nostoc sp. CMAA1605]MCF4966893.1 DUF4363 domain-containing protein [Nostoc sp. CMAA1605]